MISDDSEIKCEFPTPWVYEVEEYGKSPVYLTSRPFFKPSNDFGVKKEELEEREKIEDCHDEELDQQGNRNIIYINVNTDELAIRDETADTVDDSLEHVQCDLVIPDVENLDIPSPIQNHQDMDQVGDDMATDNVLINYGTGLPPYLQLLPPFPVDKFLCDQCEMIYEHKNSLNRHIFSHHLEHRPFHCEPCNKDFSQGSHLTVHKDRKHDKVKKFKCDDVECTKYYVTKSEMKTHYKRIHLGIKYFCTAVPNCGKSFSSLGYARKHSLKCALV